MGAMTQVCEAFAALAELCIALDAAPAWRLWCKAIQLIADTG